MYARPQDSGPADRSAIIVGCGRTGVDLAAAFSDAGYSVVILDTATASFDLLPTRLVEAGSVRPFLGDGTLASDLRRASAQDADVFVAVSGNDASNALSAQLARHTMGVPKVICRLNDPAMREMYEELGLTTVSPTGLVRDLIVEAAGD